MNNDGFVSGVAFGLVLGVILLIFTLIAVREKIIEKGFAEYNKETGDWQWKPKIVKEGK